MALTTPKPLNPAQLTPEELNFLTKKLYYNNVIIDSHQLGLRVRLDDPRGWTTAKQPCVGLDMLGKLPFELQFQVLDVTPISTLFDRRRTNSHAKQLIEQWERFRVVIIEGADAIRAFLATGAGNLWTAQQFFDVLCTTQCEFCGEQ
jgi:hypothetical protein